MLAHFLNTVIKKFIKFEVFITEILCNFLDNPRQVEHLLGCYAMLPETKKEAKLQETIAIAMASFNESFKGLCVKTEETLIEKAKQETSLPRKAQILDACSLIRSNRSKIESSFRTALAQVIQDRITTQAPKNSETFDATHLKLVDDADLETELIMKRLIRRLQRGEGASTLTDLDDRLSFLMGREELQEERNPLSPNAVCTAIRQSFEDVAKKDELKQEIFRAFEDQLSPAFLPAYQIINSQLVNRNVVPNLALWRRNRTGATNNKTADSANAQEKPARSLLEQYAQRFAPAQPGAASMPGSAPVSAAWAQGTGTGAGFGHETQIPQPAWLRSAGAGFGAEMGAPLPALQQLAQFLPSDYAVSHSAQNFSESAPLEELNWLHQVRDKARSGGVAQQEQWLIDLVAMLLDTILQDRHTSAIAKRQIARLQLPLLKVALHDQTVFSDANHPARRLIDALAESATGKQEAGEHDQAYFNLVNAVTAEVEKSFEGDLKVFEQAEQKIQDFVQVEDEKEQEEYEATAEVLQKAEQREIADLEVLTQIRDAVENLELPEELTEFLLDPWRKVIVEQKMQGGETQLLASFQQTITDLVWSVQPKVSEEERRRLTLLLPSLLRTIRQGLQRIEWPETQQHVFLDALMEAHSHAVRVGVRTEMQDQSFQQFEQRMRDPQPVIEASKVQVSPEQVASLLAHYQLPVAVAAADIAEPEDPVLLGFDAAGVVASLTRGAWVEIFDNGQTKAMKLRWISPLRTLFLFTDNSGKDAVTFTPELLRNHIASGMVVVSDERSLTERAFESMEATLESEEISA